MSSTVPFIFPKLTYIIKGKNWSLEVARTNLQVIMSVLGFGQGGEKQYKNIADKPEGWPASVDFATMKHPSYLTISQTNIVIESLLGHHGIDPYSFFDSEKEEIQPPKSKKQKKKGFLSVPTVHLQSTMWIMSVIVAQVRRLLQNQLFLTFLRSQQMTN